MQFNNLASTKMKPKTNTTLHSKKSIHRSPVRLAFLLLPLALAGFALSPIARAVTPAPDGGYPNGNTAEGDFALNDLTTGDSNTAVGASALFNNTTGNSNTAVGPDALLSNTTGNENTAVGVEALFSNTTGRENTAIGVDALISNTTGNDNAASGFEALFHNTTGIQNTATGPFALFQNTTGQFNTANGSGALQANVGGTANSATGESALSDNTSGNDNTANGVNALFFNTTGHDNTAVGLNALINNKTGANNIALGATAGSNLTTGGNNIDIGAPGVAAEANTIRIGKSAQKKTFIAGIRGVTVASGVGVIVGTNGQLGTVLSSARFKEAIKPMDKSSEAILALKPVTFRYKEELDPDRIPQFGLVAEEVEKVNPDLVARDEDGKVNTVRYEAVNAMLLNEFLKQHRKVEEQQATIAELKSNSAKQATTVAQQQKQIEALTATVQKVTDQIALSKPAPQLVANPLK
jgi:hypothetical protein